MRNPPPYIPERGDFVYVNFDPQAGHEQVGRRPAIVLSPKRYSRKTGLVICCPITTRIKGYAFETLIPDGLSVDGVVLADQVKNFDFTARHISFAGVAPNTLVEAVLEKLKLLL